jgi:hypothetical protein
MLAVRKKGEDPAEAEATCKMLHFAFRGMTTEDVYDTLAFCFVRAARKYDPYYADKTKQVCEVIGDLGKQFTVDDVEDRVGFACTGILRALVRKGFLSSVVGKKRVVGYKLGSKWPAPASFFESGPIGFVYVLQIWFRYFLNEFVVAQMAHLEAGGNVLQLGLPESGEGHTGQGGLSQETIQRHAEGNCVTADGGFRFMADRTLMDAPLDVSSMNLDWVAGTTDRLFRGLTTRV